jgi:hypothetical protein
MRYAPALVTFALVSAVGLVMQTGCSSSSPAGPSFDLPDFVANVDNPFFPLEPGTVFRYEGETEGQIELNTVTVKQNRKTILGVNCTVVADSVWLYGELAEATLDWYDQDVDGNVWYLGEDSKEIENGVVVSTEGSWEAGVDGAEPGYIMLANPDVGDSYRQEYYEGEAEDMAEVVSLTESVTVPYGNFLDCLQTEEWSPLEAGVSEYKYYASGVGHVYVEDAAGGGDYSGLVSITVQ